MSSLNNRQVKPSSKERGDRTHITVAWDHPPQRPRPRLLNGAAERRAGRCDRTSSLWQDTSVCSGISLPNAHTKPPCKQLCKNKDAMQIRQPYLSSTLNFFCTKSSALNSKFEISLPEPPRRVQTAHSSKFKPHPSVGPKFRPKNCVDAPVNG